MRVEHIGLATLYLGDCREIAVGLERPAAVISDPPYGQKLALRKKSKGGQWNDWTPIVGDDEAFDPRPWLAMAERVILWGAHHFYQFLPPPQIACQRAVGWFGINDVGAAIITRAMQKWLGSIARKSCV